MSRGPASDPLTPDGLQVVTLRNLIGTVTDIVRGSNATGDPIAAGLIICENTSAATAFVQFFNLAKANVTLGTTRPTFEVIVPATTGFVQVLLPVPHGGFPAGLSAASTTATE